MVNTHGDVGEGGAGEAADVGAEAVTHAVEAEAGVEAVGQAQQTLTHTWSEILIGQQIQWSLFCLAEFYSLLIILATATPMYLVLAAAW